MCGSRSRCRQWSCCISPEPVRGRRGLTNHLAWPPPSSWCSQKSNNASEVPFLLSSKTVTRVRVFYFCGKVPGSLALVRCAEMLRNSTKVLIQSPPPPGEPPEIITMCTQVHPAWGSWRVWRSAHVTWPCINNGTLSITLMFSDPTGYFYYCSKISQWTGGGVSKAILKHSENSARVSALLIWQNVE